MKAALSEDLKVMRGGCGAIRRNGVLGREHGRGKDLRPEVCLVVHGTAGRLVWPE